MILCISFICSFTLAHSRAQHISPYQYTRLMNDNVFCFVVMVYGRRSSLFLQNVVKIQPDDNDPPFLSFYTKYFVKIYFHYLIKHSPRTPAIVQFNCLIFISPWWGFFRYKYMYWRSLSVTQSVTHSFSSSVNTWAFVCYYKQKTYRTETKKWDAIKTEGRTHDPDCVYPATESQPSAFSQSVRQTQPNRTIRLNKQNNTIK